ncbi:thioesterase-like superfamily-domain-containing protein [Elsinoe ampelina]|uniref:Thioesterase-like superfamily-domain-containing protein n=1 Tax=Elsinoe ampelina TaxID=302913 RepID=A0A6A6GAM2_9PEZI|nr:thioesterase-like superfamily-domain-containing protein [Elsinoe ampelina]
MSTLIKPPPARSGQSPIESVLELTHLRDIDPNLFTNTRQLWHPPGARGIYGGAVIAQCLAAAQRTVPETFTVHSMHCYFVLAGNADIPVIYHVERVRTGKSYATRTVQARQRGAVIFTVTMSFVRENSGGDKRVEHAVPMPDVPGPYEGVDKESALVTGGGSPFESQRIDILNNDSEKAEEKRTRQWIRARGKISDEGGFQAHLSALAYMSDSYFIGTVARVHKLWRYSGGKGGKKWIDDAVVKKLQEMDGETLRRMQGMDEDVIAALKNGGVSEGSRPEVGMMVSLDHTIYFHEPRAFRADEWMFTEMESPWAGDGRGVVFQRIYTREGKLVATCVQEGVVRLRQDEGEKAKL